jgi:hypothetical protein
MQLRPIIPNDVLFRTEFAVAHANRSDLARYILYTIEAQRAQVNEPHYVPNEEADQINLEHILPIHPGPGWTHISSEEAASNYHRLGNLALLPSSVNRKIGNADFSKKKTQRIISESAARRASPSRRAVSALSDIIG